MPDMGRGIIAPANGDNIGTGASEMRALASTAATALDSLEASVGTALDGKVSAGDPRLSDARTPLAHTHSISDVSGLLDRLAALEYRSGRRNITALLDPAPSSGNLFIERRGDTVWLHMDALTLSTTSDTIYNGVIASGFQIVSPGDIPAAQRSVLDAKGGLRTYGSNLGFYYLGQAAGPFRGMVSWPTNQAIPATLPGSPA